MTKDSFGVWECVVPAVKGQPAIPHNSKIKVRPSSCSPPLVVLPPHTLTPCAAPQISMTTPSGERIERLPAWAKCVLPSSAAPQARRTDQATETPLPQARRPGRQGVAHLRRRVLEPAQGAALHVQEPQAQGAPGRKGL